MLELYNKVIKKHFPNAVMLEDPKSWFVDTISIPADFGSKNNCYFISRVKSQFNEHAYVYIREPEINGETVISHVDPDTGRDCTNPYMQPKMSEISKRIHGLIKDFYTPNSIKFIKSLV